MIFFDIDDTLLDDRHAQDEAARGLWRAFRHLLPYSEAEFPAVWDEASARHYHFFTTGEVSFTEQRRRRIREIFRQPTLPDAETDARFARYLAFHEDNWTLFPDTLPCLDALAGHRLGVISNGDPQQQRRKLDKTGIAQRFSVVVISGDIGKPKPQPEIFLHACRLAGVQPEECIYIGDNPVFDVQGSRGVGMCGVWLNRRGAPAERVGAPIITSLDELLAAQT
jgi:putative hydrolase of the HAD superfamily